MTASLQVIRAELHAAIRNVAPGRAAVDELCLACVALLDVDGAAVSTVHQGAPQWTFGCSDESSRRLDEHQFTFGEGPCIDAVATRRPVLVPDLRAAQGGRWPVFAEAALADGVHGVFALPIAVASRPVGALDLFRVDPGPLQRDALAGAVVAADLAARSLLHLLTSGALNRDHDRDQDQDQDIHSTSAVADDPALGEPDASGAPGRVGRRRTGDAMDVNRVEVYQATGILIYQLDVAPGEAVLRLRAHAMATGRSVSEVAFDIIDRRLSLRRDGREGRTDEGRGTE